MPDQDYLRGRWENKYIIKKRDGRDVDPNAIYFVLRLDADPNARAAAIEYAHSVASDNPLFALDILRKVNQPVSYKFQMTLMEIASRLAEQLQEARNKGFRSHTEVLNQHREKLAKPTRRAKK